MPTRIRARHDRPDKASAFEPLREQACALAVVPDHFDQVAALTAKDEQMAAVRLCGTLHNRIYVAGGIMWRRWPKSVVDGRRRGSPAT